MSGYVVPVCWHEAGDRPGEYWMGIDPSMSRSGSLSVTLKCKVSEASGFGTLMQTIQADQYRRTHFTRCQLV